MKKMLSALLTLTALFTGLSVASANPACGAVIFGTVTLTGDMDCRSSLTHGLILDSNTTLDCAGNLLWGPDMSQPNGTQTGRYGLEINEVANVTVRNCVIKGYERGVRITGSTNVTVEGGNSKKNTRYGYNVGTNSMGIVLTGNSAINNGDEGFHVGGPLNYSGGPPLLIENCVAYLNWQEGIYLHNAAGTTVRNCTISENSQDPNASHPGLNIDVSTDWSVENTYVDTQVRIIGTPQVSFSACSSSIAGGCN